MKKIFIKFPAFLLMSLGMAVNAQNSESYATVNSDKTILAYNHSPELVLWENIAGQGGDITELQSLRVSYNLTEHQFIVKGTKAHGDVEVWDVNGNTVAEKTSGDNKTIIKVKALPHGSYYINYSNGNYAESTKVVIK